MTAAFHRRKFLTSMMGIPAAGMLMSADAKDEYKKKFPAKGLKTSLNAYSFNKPLTNGSMSIAELIEFCAENQCRFVAELWNRPHSNPCAILALDGAEQGILEAP